MVLVVDETQQDTILADDVEWLPFARLARELQSPVQVFSFHAVSQWDGAGCGLEGGLLHCHGVPPQALDYLRRRATGTSGTNFMAQAFVASALTPPSDAAGAKDWNR